MKITVLTAYSYILYSWSYIFAINQLILFPIAFIVADNQGNVISNEIPQSSIINSDSSTNESCNPSNKQTSSNKDEDESITPHSTKPEMKFNFASNLAGAVIMDKAPSNAKYSNILENDNDEYVVIPCNEKKKLVVIGLSEDIVVNEIVIANFERYSSMFKDFQLLASSIYPTEEWMDLGTFHLKASLGEQSFNITTSSAYSRYLKIKFLTHYEHEQLCTLSQVKVHGTTVIASLTQEVELEDSYFRDLKTQLQLEDLNQVTFTDSSENDTLFSSTSVEEESNQLNISTTEEYIVPDNDFTNVISPNDTINNSNGIEESIVIEDSAKAKCNNNDSIAVTNDFSESKDVEQNSAPKVLLETTTSISSPQEDISHPSIISSIISVAAPLLGLSAHPLVNNGNGIEESNSPEPIVFVHQMNESIENNNETIAQLDEESNNSTFIESTSIDLIDGATVVTTNIDDSADLSSNTDASLDTDRNESINLDSRSHNIDETNLLEASSILDNKVMVGNNKEQILPVENVSTDEGSYVDKKSAQSTNQGADLTNTDKSDDSITTLDSSIRNISNRSSNATVSVSHCLELLRFDNYQAKIRSKYAAIADAGEKIANPSGSQENVFKQLLQRIRAMELNYAILEMYTSQVSECYQFLLLEVEPILINTYGEEYMNQSIAISKLRVDRKKRLSTKSSGSVLASIDFLHPNIFILNISNLLALVKVS